MNQMLFLLVGLLGIAGIGALVANNDDDHAPDEPADDPFGGRDLIEGTAEDDTIEGTAGDDAIQSFAGNDSVDAGEGDDLVWTGYGQDTVSADAGDDAIFLGFDDDVYGAYDLGADEGHDSIDGGSGNDTITTNLGSHSITGGYGNDVIHDEGGTVYIDGGEDHDLIYSQDAGNPDAPDTLLGGDGDDTIYAGAHDIVDGGDGADAIYLSSASTAAAEIVLERHDSLTVEIAADYDGRGEYTLEQDGDDVRVLLDGRPLALLRDIQAGDVPTILLQRLDA